MRQGIQKKEVKKVIISWALEATQEAEIRRISVCTQSRQIVL
jgi:hypothetical protein